MSLVPDEAMTGMETASTTARNRSIRSASVSTEPSPVVPATTIPVTPGVGQVAGHGGGGIEVQRAVRAEGGDHGGHHRPEAGRRSSSRPGGRRWEEAHGIAGYQQDRRPTPEP